MDMNYDIWINHGEHINQVQGEYLMSTNNEPINNSNVNMFNMIDDAFGRMHDDDDDDCGCKFSPLRSWTILHLQNN